MSFVLATTLGAHEPSRAPAMIDLLTRYAAGEYDTVATAVATQPNAGKFRDDLGNAAGRWIGEGGPAQIATRRLTAAAFALEAAGALDDPNWPVRRELIEWGFDTVKATQPPLPAERWWHLAATSLIERMGDYIFLTVGRGRSPQNDPAWTYLPRAQKRFPDEPRLALASAVSAVMQAGKIDRPVDIDLGYGIRVSEPLAETASADIVASGSTKHSAWAPIVRTAVRGFAALENSEPVRAEAHLRLGELELYFGQHEAALAHFKAAEAATSDPFLSYCARLFEGASLARSNDLAGAERAYRAALEIVPHAESGTTGLAMALALQGRQSEASAVVNEMLAASQTTVDPLLLFPYGDARWWAPSIERLRAALR